MEGENSGRKRRSRRLLIIFIIFIGASFSYVYSNTTVDVSMPLSSFGNSNRNVSMPLSSFGNSNTTVDVSMQLSSFVLINNENENRSFDIQTEDANTSNVLQEDKFDGYLIDTPGCRIPDLPAVQSSTKRYFKPQEKDPKCETREWPLNGKKLPRVRGPALIKSNLTTLWLHHPALKDYNLSSSADISCCYRTFWRVQENPKKYHTSADNRSKFSKVCTPFDDDKVVVNSSVEFVRVECSMVNNATKNVSEIYRDFHVFMPRKPKVEERCQNISAAGDEVSVLVIGMDSVSRLNMIRQLPETYKLLSSPPLSAIPLLGYNKVGDNTFPNLVPLLMGLSAKEIKTTCLRKQKQKFDACPFIWKNYSSKGYKTAYGEDTTYMSTFNYQRTGFVVQPVDYYARPYLMESLNQQGNVKSMNVKLCTGPRQTFQYTLDYINKFALQFAKERYFGFFWSSAVSHDNINMPHIGDKILHAMLRELLSSGALERTVLVLMSDHGMRFGSFRETYQGRIEERLPFVLISIPQWFRERFPTALSNLQMNAHNRLTTPYDLHEMLLDLLEAESLLAPEILLKRSESLASERNFPRGTSLFLPVSSNRTCEQAGIDLHWCTCQASTPISTKLSEVETSAAFCVKKLNKQLHSYSDCEELKLLEVKSAAKIHPHKEGVPTKIKIPKVEYLLVFSTEPGEAVFEATVRHTVNKKKQVSVELAGSISRINTYNNQSDCVTDVNIKLYCYCKLQNI